MPKNPPQDKKTDRKRAFRATRTSAHGRQRAAPQALGDIMKKQGWIAGLSRAHDENQALLAHVLEMLPEELRRSLVGVTHQGGQLTVLASTAAWCSRIRYALAALDPQSVAGRSDIVKVVVRVLPAGRARAR
ncbi:MAG: DciA family protein [Steroidobacteraceae bacterium]